MNTSQDHNLHRTLQLQNVHRAGLEKHGTESHGMSVPGSHCESAAGSLGRIYIVNESSPK